MNKIEKHRGCFDFEFSYDLQAYFQEHDYLNITSVAKFAGLNPGLVRQYASGVKYPSNEQANKLRNAINKIAQDLLEHSIYVHKKAAHNVSGLVVGCFR